MEYFTRYEFQTNKLENLFIEPITLNYKSIILNFLSSKSSFKVFLVE